MSIEARREVRDELLADLDAVTASIVSAVRAEIPAYDTLSAGQLEEVAAIAAWGTSRVLEAWVADSRLEDDDLRRFRGIGAARALDGRPLPVVLRAYRVAGTAVTDLVADRGLDRLEVVDALALAQLWMASIDALSEALYAGHSAASARLGSDRRQALSDLLEDLLAGRHTTPSAIADRSRELEVRLPRRPVLLVAAAGPGGTLDEEAWLARVDDVVRQVDEDGATRHLARVRDGVGVALLPQAADASVVQALGPPRSRGVALRRHALHDLPRAYRLAAHALTRAPERAYASRGVLMDVDAAALAVAAGHRDAAPDLLHELALGRLSTRPGLLVGLAAYLSTGSAVEAAGLAQCHPQTMRYRIRRVRELTGLDPRRAWDRFVLELASLSYPGPTVEQ